MSYIVICCVRELLSVVIKFHAFLKALSSEWRDQTNSAEIPSELLSCTELVLDRHDNLCEINRLPGENEVNSE